MKVTLYRYVGDSDTANKLLKLGARQNDKNPLPQLIDVDEIPQLDSPKLIDDSQID